MTNVFIAISVLLQLISPLVYTRAVLRGQAKPHRTTRFVLLVLTTLATISLFISGDRVAVWLAGVSMLQGILVFTLSLKYGMGGWSKIDISCLIIALVGIIMWQITKQPIIALYFAIGADLVGMIPTIIKTYRLPKTEIYMFFLMDSIAATFNMLALKSWTIEQFSYPIYIMIINAFMVLLIVRPKKIS